MYKIGICDDGENICSSIEKMIMNFSCERKLNLETIIYNTGEGLCDYLQQGNDLDILFLDIELLQMTGIEVGNFIRNQLNDRSIQIVYISGKSNYAAKLFKTQPLDFLIKPIEENQVHEVLELADKILQKSMIQFEYQQGKEYYRLPYKEIMCFFSEGRKIRILTEKDTREYYGKLKEIIPSLPSNFLVIHQSYVVNNNFVVRYTYDQVELADGTILTISKPNRKRIRQQLLRRTEL